MRREVKTMIPPMMGKDIKVGRPRGVQIDRSKRAERLDGRVRERESVAEYQRRMIGQIESLDWGTKGEGDEPEL